MEEKKQYEISKMYFFDNENCIMLSLNPKEWTHENIIEIELVFNNKKWQVQYLGFGNIEGELAVKLFLLEDNMEEIRNYWCEKNRFCLCVYRKMRI